MLHCLSQVALCFHPRFRRDTEFSYDTFKVSCCSFWFSLKHRIWQFSCSSDRFVVGAVTSESFRLFLCRSFDGTSESSKRRGNRLAAEVTGSSPCEHLTSLSGTWASWSYWWISKGQERHPCVLRERFASFMICPVSVLVVPNCAFPIF